ncbi:MAG: F0F1 ATP synthase subunit gamma, partial [bacterium]|nr:F0F1 ATP synthase subunit gamma [bacterium]
IRNIAAAGGLSHPLLERREVKTSGVLVVTSDRGLAGGYNSNVLRLAERALNEHRANNRPIQLYVIGAKAESYFRYRGYQIQDSFLGVTDTPTYGDARAVANILLDDYEQEKMDSVEVYTTRFVSALTQTPVLWPLLPIEPPEMSADTQIAGYSFEPSPEEILGRLLPRYLEGTIFGILLEASASEHAARRRAMKAATENAEEL